MKSNKFLIIVFYFLTIGCHEKNIKKEIIDNKKEKFKKSNYFKEDRIKNDKYEVKNNGNEHSYSELELYYSYNDSRREEILPYTLLIVEKYKKYNHCTTAFNNLLEFYTEEKLQYDGSNRSLNMYLQNIKQLNHDQRNYLIYFLKLGAMNNDIGSINYLEMLNREGIGINKNLQKADSLKKVLIMLKKI